MKIITNGFFFIPNIELGYAIQWNKDESDKVLIWIKGFCDYPQELLNRTYVEAKKEIKRLRKDSLFLDWKEEILNQLDRDLEDFFQNHQQTVILRTFDYFEQTRKIK